MKEKSLTSRQKQAIATRKKIFDTTVDLIAQTGFDKITIRRICKEAEVSTGTFYLYFKSKQDILMKIYQDADMLIDESDILDNTGLTSIEKIKELVKIQTSLAENIDIDILKQVYICHLDSDNEYFLSEDRSFFTTLNNLILDGQTKGQLTDETSSKEISWKVLRFIRGVIYDWLIRDGSYPLEETACKELSLYLGLFKNN